MSEKETIKMYTELHGRILGQREDLYIKVASLIKEMDYEGITDRYDREIRTISLIEKEIGVSKDIEMLKSLAISLFQPKARQVASRTAA